MHALFTTRNGGVSQAPFDTLNLGDHVRDDPAAVAANRRTLTHVISSTTCASEPVFLQQVHGCDVLKLEPGAAQGLSADACVATTPGVVCTIMVADCLPVLFAHPKWRVVAAAHAGWRGLAGTHGQGVLETTFARFVAEVQAASAQKAIKNEEICTPESIASEMQVWLGPCIGPEAFEVGDEVRAAFCDLQPQAATCFAPGQAPGKWWADLAGLARLRLQQLGLNHIYGNDSSRQWCTVSQPARFFSHRRDAAVLGSTGRMAACIWLSA